MRPDSPRLIAVVLSGPRSVAVIGHDWLAEIYGTKIGANGERFVGGSDDLVGAVVLGENKLDDRLLVVGQADRETERLFKRDRAPRPAAAVIQTLAFARRAWFGFGGAAAGELSACFFE